MEYIPAKTIVTRNKSTMWFGETYNMNIYRGCSHGCIYCDSRSMCYQIDNFERVRAKENALEIIRDDLRRKVKKGVIGTGAMSDPYNPFEKKYELTRHSLELISAYGFGVGIATKSDLITRDKDILREISRHSPVLAKLTITTPHDDLSKKIEPYAPSSSQRFIALQELSKAGVFAGVLMMPLLPWITDNKDDILRLLEKVSEAGGRFVYPSFGLTMREGQREHLYSSFDKDFPELRQKYHSRYGSGYHCAVPRAKELYHFFQEQCKRLGLLYDMKDIVSAYKQGYQSEQLSFF